MLVETAAETTDVTDDVEYVAATTDGNEAISTSPILFVPAGNAVEIVTAPVLHAVTLPFNVERVLSVAAPVGKLMVPETLVMFHVPLCVAATVPSTVIEPALSLIGIADVKGFACDANVTFGKVRTSTSPMLLVPAGKAVEIVTAPVLQAVTLPLSVERVLSVAAPVGNETVPVMFVRFHVPD